MSGNAFVADQRSGWLRAKVLAKQRTQSAETTGKNLSLSQASMPSTLSYSRSSGPSRSFVW